MNKKFDRVLQWSKEKMGNDSKTAATDEFRAMEMEMQMRHEGMEKLHSSASIYIKSLSKRREGDDREKMIPVDIVGQSMVLHGEEFEQDSLYGQCLTNFGRAHESIARVQETYVQNINDNWLLGLERDLTHMKEYQAARRKLESRRLAYDTAQSKMQKQKKEDFRLEDELRSQRIKYEELSDEVSRRMNDIRDGEQETLMELGAFLDAELEYYDKCRNLLMRVKEQWPVPTKKSKDRSRSRSNTAHSFNNGFTAKESPREYEEEEEPQPVLPERPSIKSRGVSATHTSTVSDWDSAGRQTPELRSRASSWKIGGEALSRTSSVESYTAAPTRMLRTVTEPIPPPLPAGRGGSGLRPVITRTPSYNTQNEDQSPTEHPSPESRPLSRPLSRNASSQSLGGSSGARKVVPPPPPASRGLSGKKPPPPPPPVKRAGLSNLSINE